MFSTPEELALVCAALLLAEAVYVLLGFGAGLVAVGLVALVMGDVRDVVVLLLIVNLPVEAWVVAGSWRQVRWRGVLLLLAGVAVGIPAGAWWLQGADQPFLLRLLGAVLVAAGGAFLAVPGRLTVHCPAWAAPGVGVVSGVLTGMFGTGGPPLVLYYQLAGTDKAAFRGGLMTIFLAMGLLRLPTYGILGLITVERMLSALLLLPLVAAGAWLGQRVHVRLDEAAFRRLVSVALALIGILLLVGGG